MDTDIGSDIDDAVCLAYLLAQPKCDLLGITTVSGEAEKRAQLASVLCNIAERDVPIFPGASKPLIISSKQKKAQQAKALENWEHKEKFPQGKAIEFLRKTIHKHPGEINLLAIGPLTNIGLLFKVDPEIPSLLKNLVLMSGVFTNQLSGVGPLEWNAINDPHATSIVYNTPVTNHFSIGLDVTCQVTMKADEVRKKFKSDLLQPVLDFAEIWFNERDIITFHDPLAAATIFNSEICNFTSGNVEVELLSDRVKGMTYWDTDVSDKSHKVALEVDRDRFFEHYFSIF